MATSAIRSLGLASAIAASLLSLQPAHAAVCIGRDWETPPDSTIGSLPGAPPADFLTENGVWTGVEVLVAGTRAGGDSWRAFDPVDRSWRVFAPSPGGAAGVKLFRIGAYVIAWYDAGQSNWILNLSDEIWTPLPPAPLSPRTEARATVSDRELFVAGGKVEPPLCAVFDGARFNPTRSAWTPVSRVAGANPSDRLGGFYGWIGSRLLSAGGAPWVYNTLSERCDFSAGDLAPFPTGINLYDPSTDTAVHSSTWSFHLSAETGLISTQGRRVVFPFLAWVWNADTDELEEPVEVDGARAFASVSIWTGSEHVLTNRDERSPYNDELGWLLTLGPPNNVVRFNSLDATSLDRAHIVVWTGQELYLQTDGTMLLFSPETIVEVGPDEDGDGVGDVCDFCPGTPSNGVDRDGDGVGDACDPCPLDAYDDEDGDGLCADVDPCPSSTLNDVDDDGVCTDNCPLLPNTDQADLDGDLVGDACDPCTDSDGDGAGDPGFPNAGCAPDLCPDNPAKTVPGVCGCLTEDVDGDGNGKPDCINDVSVDSPWEVQWFYPTPDLGPNLEAIRHPAYGSGVIATLIAGNNLSVVRILGGLPQGLASAALRPGARAPIDVRFDTSGLFGESLYVAYSWDITSGGRTAMLAVTPDGDVSEVWSTLAGLVYRFDFSDGGAGYPPGGLLVDGAGAAGQGVSRWDPETGLHTLSDNSFPAGRTDTDPRAIEFDRGGSFASRLHVTDCDSNDDGLSAIYQLLPDLSWLPLTAVDPTEQRCYWDLAVGKGGPLGARIYVTERVADEVVVVDPGGSTAPFASGFDGVDALTMAEDGAALFVSDRRGIYRIGCAEDTGYSDADGDGAGEGDLLCEPNPSLAPVGGDCDDGDGTVWARPELVRHLRFLDSQTLVWDEPTVTGAAELTYTVFRSLFPQDFTTPDACSAEGTLERLAVESGEPPEGDVWNYLVRAMNACPGPLGMGSAGHESSGSPRLVGACPGG